MPPRSKTAQEVRDVREIISRKNHGFSEKAGIPPARHAARRTIEQRNLLRDLAGEDIK